MDQTLPPSILLFAPAKGSPSKSASGRNLSTEVYAISVEVPAVFKLDEDPQSVATSFPPITHRFLSLPRSRLNLLPGTRVSLGVSFGGGFGHFSESNKLNYFATNPGGSSNGMSRKN